MHFTAVVCLSISRENEANCKNEKVEKWGGLPGSRGENVGQCPPFIAIQGIHGKDPTFFSSSPCLILVLHAGKQRSSCKVVTFQVVPIGTKTVPVNTLAPYQVAPLCMDVSSFSSFPHAQPLMQFWTYWCRCRLAHRVPVDIDSNYTSCSVPSYMLP